MAAIAGESFLGVRTFNEIGSVLPGLAMSVARIFALSTMYSNPYMKLVALTMNAYGTYSVVQRAFFELQKCWQVSKTEHSWQVARNVFVHGVNASCSIYNTVSIFDQCARELFPRSSSGLRGTDFLRRVYSEPQISKEMPIIKPSQISEEIVPSGNDELNVTMVSASDSGIKQYADLVAPNQKAFAVQKSYGYVRYSGNLTVDRAPYWSKIVAIWDQLQKTKEGQWIAWVDASAVITNTNKSFEQVIQSYGQGKDLILTTDPQIPINNAVFLIKNTSWARNFIQRVWSRSDLAVGGRGNCGSRDFPHCHYEQQSMTELWEKEQSVKRHTAVISNKNMNSFYRYSHHDPYRNMNLNYNDPEHSKWAPADFICKVTGMDKDRRYKMIQYVLKRCVDSFCRVPTSDYELGL